MSARRGATLEPAELARTAQDRAWSCLQDHREPRWTTTPPPPAATARARESRGELRSCAVACAAPRLEPGECPDEESATAVSSSRDLGLRRADSWARPVGVVEPRWRVPEPRRHADSSWRAPEQYAVPRGRADSQRCRGVLSVDKQTLRLALSPNRSRSQREEFLGKERATMRVCVLGGEPQATAPRLGVERR